MFTVIWRIDGFHVIDLMTEQHSYNTQYFLSRVLEPLLFAVFPDVCKPHCRWLSFHLHNYRIPGSKVSVHFFAENSIIPVPHPPYSPDLAPSDFWFFGHMKAALAGQQFSGSENLLSDSQEFMSEIQRSELELVFHHWIERVQWVLDKDEDYFHE
jgi:hypothetical protein